MSSIDNSTRKAQQAELNDLHAEFNRKKKDLVRENENQLSDLKSHYDDKKEGLTEQNEAAINHIRTRQKEMNNEAVSERQRLTENYNSKTSNLVKNYDEKLEDMREHRDQQLSKTKESTSQRVRTIEGQAQNQVSNIRNKSEADIKRAKEKYNKDMGQLNEYSQTRLDQQREQNESSVHNEVERGRNVTERVRTRNEKDAALLDQRGKEKIALTQEQGQKKLTRTEEENKRLYEKRQEQWEAKEEGLDTKYSNRLIHNKESYDNQLKTQHNRFQRVYQKNNEAQRESLNIQNEQYVKELAATKKEFINKNENYANKADDPFYKVQDRGSYIRENPDFYILRAFVPEHEKDSVKVNIQKDKATVSGQRSFKDKLEDGDKFVSSNSYQTFREEFPFENPVITAGMTRQRDGDWIEFRIPKFSSGPRLDKKV